MPKTNVLSKETTEVSAPTLLRVEDPWPRMAHWLDSIFPVDLTWRGRPHLLRVEEIQRDGSVILRVEAPGVDPEKDLDITVDEGYLTISGRREIRETEPSRSEFYYGEFVRTLPLPTGVDPKSISAEYANGILEIKLKRVNGQGKARHIPIVKTEE